MIGLKLQRKNRQSIDSIDRKPAFGVIFKLTKSLACKLLLNFGRILHYLAKQLPKTCSVIFNHSKHYVENHKVLVNSSFIVSVVVVLILSNSNFSDAAYSYWIQSDWSGGAGSSTTNQYSSQSNLTTSSSGNMTLVHGSNLLTNGNFSSDLSNWNGGITPSQISGMDLWLNASSITGVSSGGKVSAWADSSGSSNNFSQASSSLQPLYETNVINGQPAVQFAPNDELTQSGSLIHGSVFIVGSRSNTSSPFAEVGGGTISNGRGLIGLYYPTYATYTNYFVNGASQSTGGGGSLNTTSIFSGTSPSPLTSTSFALGQGTPSYAYLQGDIEELIIYNSSLSTANREGVEAYLQAKYNVSGSEYVNATRNTSTTYSGDTASAQLVSGSVGGQYVQAVNVGNTNTYDLQAYAYTNGSTVSSSNAQLTYNGTPVTTTYTSVGGGWSLLSAAVTGIASSTNYGVQVAANQTVYIDGVALQNITTSGTLTSNIFNTNIENNWGDLTYTDSLPAGTSISILVRAGNVANLSDAPNFTSCSAIVSGGTITSSCAPNKSQYVQYQVALASTIPAYTPDLESLSIAFTPSDITPPPTNASAITAHDGSGGATVSSDGWANTDPYFSWTAGADEIGGSGIQGYCLYLGQDSTGNPVTTEGVLGTSPINSGGACQYVVSSANLDTSIAGVLGTALASTGSPYYLNIKAIDNADNVYNGSSAQFEFLYDNVPPTNPSFITAPSEFVSSKNVTLTWATTGGDAPGDDNSGVAGLQYRIGSSGTWYGANHNGSQNMTDLLPNNGSYTTVSTPDYANLIQGNNIVYFRTWDNAGNISQAYVTTVIKINSTAPSSPQNLVATPTTNTTNSFGFSWLAPVTYTGSASNITYCYTVNVLPTSSNCTFTAAGQTSLDPGAYATEPGDNTFYLVAKDEASNINYATASNVTFTANTPAPGIPLNLDISDISIKSTSSWKLALSWDVPSTVGAGIATYKIFRSTDGINFTDIANTAGTSYVDSNLNQQTYYYQLEACDSANNCGSFTSPVNDFPTGKFTSPANLLDGPTVTVDTRTATINWETDRASDSRIEYGLSSNDYGATEASNSDQVTSHSINLDNLQAGTTYYYRAQWDDIDGNIGTSSEQTFTTLPAPTVSDVNVLDVNLSSALIQFTSDGASSATVYYGGSKGFGLTQKINTASSSSTYEVPLNQLTPGTNYYFKIDPFDAQGNEYDQTIFTFTTPPQPTITNVEFQPVPGALTGTEQISWTTNVPTTSQISYGLLNGTRSNQLDTDFTTTHSMTVSDLTYDTQYSITATSVDTLGNVANSDLQVFKSGIDTRPPVISDVTIQPSIIGNGASAQGQLIVSWKTDKAGTSQVAYGQGVAGDYTTRTAENSAIVNNHVVVVSGLGTAQVYHVQVISNDADGIKGVSGDQTTIVGQASDNALSIVFNSLQEIFGL